MRKKTIKSYFFNTPYKNPAVPYLFCFSKRAFRYNKLMLKFLNKRNHRQLNQRNTTMSMNQYKNLIIQRIRVNQWILNNQRMHLFYKKSYFYTNNTLSKFTNKTKLILWFKFKNKFHRFFLIFLKNYTHLGILSSHFVHILSRKNLTYQVWSKYRARVFDINNTTKYTSTCTSLVSSYSWSILILLYSYNLHPATVLYTQKPENVSLNLSDIGNIELNTLHTGGIPSYLYKVNEHININNIVDLKNLTDALQTFSMPDYNDTSDTLKVFLDTQFSQRGNLLSSGYFNTYVLSQPVSVLPALSYYHIIYYICVYK